MKPLEIRLAIPVPFRGVITDKLKSAKTVILDNGIMVDDELFIPFCNIICMTLETETEQVTSVKAKKK